MEMVFNEGKLTPIFTWEMFTHQFKRTRGMVTIPIESWYRAKDNAWITLAGRKSIMSDAQAVLKIYPDTLHIGRYIVSVYVKSKHTDTAMPLGVLYNGRKYKYFVNKTRRSWEVMFDGKYLSISVPRTPLMTFNRLPELNKARVFTKPIKFIFEDVPGS